MSIKGLPATYSARRKARNRNSEFADTGMSAFERMVGLRTALHEALHSFLQLRASSPQLTCAQVDGRARRTGQSQPERQSGGQGKHRRHFRVAGCEGQACSQKLRRSRRSLPAPRANTQRSNQPHCVSRLFNLHTQQCRIRRKPESNRSSSGACDVARDPRLRVYVEYTKAPKFNTSHQNKAPTVSTDSAVSAAFSGAGRHCLPAAFARALYSANQQLLRRCACRPLLRGSTA